MTGVEAASGMRVRLLVGLSLTLVLASAMPVRATSDWGPGAVCARWKVQFPQGLPGLNLTDVVAVSSTLAWAVGSYSGPAAPKILRWDGNSWADEHVRLPEGELNGVAAISATDAWAIGFDNVIEPVAVHWDGSSWSVVPTPVPGSYHYMYGIDGAAPDDVWAVGNYDDTQGHLRPLAMHWDGTAWSVAVVPEAPQGNNIFYGVHAVATDDVWAVGLRSAGGFDFQPLIDHWDGTSWSIVPVSPPAGNNNQLYAVSGTAVDDAWAVGFYDDPVKPLIEHWDGTAWIQMDGPPLPDSNEAFDVATISATDAWATGIRLSDQRGFTMHWDGTEWNVVSVPHPGEQSAAGSISASSSRDVWAVGSYLPPGSTVYPLTTHTKGCR